MTQKEIKNLVACGVAKVINYDEAQKIGRRLDTVGLSYGVYGMNAGLFRDREDGTIYAVTSRNSTLFYLA